MSLKNVPGFKYDEATGKYLAVPADFRKLIEKELGLPDSRNSSCWRWPESGSKCALKSEEKSATRQPNKFRRLESGIRKELFKVPTSFPQAKPRKIVRKSLIKELPKLDNQKKVEVKKLTASRSPKLRRVTEEVDGVKTIPTTPKMETDTENKENQTTPDLNTTIDEFEKFEQLYKTPKGSDAKDTQSPMTNVCNLFQKNMLLENQNRNKDDIISEIQRIIKEDEELCEQILEKQIKHRHNLQLIKSLTVSLSDAKDPNDKNEDNSSSRRRSLRLKNKSPDKTKPLGSPVILKSGDLRRTTLNKSLASKVQKYHGENTRIQKALDMYNTTKQNCNILLTPKLARNGKCVFSPSTTSPANHRVNISVKVQEQCMSLLGSPNVSD